MTTGGTTCPYCGIHYLPGHEHLCHIITTTDGMLVGARRHEVVDLVRSLDAATKRIAELEAWQNEATGRLTALETECDEMATVIASQRAELAWLQHIIDEQAKALADNATNGRVLKRALELACELLEPADSPTAWLGLTPNERVFHFIEQARRELADE